MGKSKLVRANEVIAENVTKGYRKIRDTVVNGYRELEDAFVEEFLTRGGETVAEAKERLRSEQEERAAQSEEQRRLRRESTEWHIREAREKAHINSIK